MDTGVLNKILSQIDVFLVTALPFLRPDAFNLFNAMVVLTILFSGIWMAFGNNTIDMQFWLKKILLIGFFAFLVNNWLPVTDMVLQSFAKLGLKAGAGGGAGITIGEFFSPSSIVDMGVTITIRLFDQIDNWWAVVQNNLGELILTAFAAIIVIISFFVLALQVMITIIEFKLVTLAGFVLLPFALFSKTSFLAERVIGYVFSAGIKLFVLAVIVTFGLAIVPGWSIGTQANLNEALGVMGASLLIMGLSIFAPAAASALISGGPALSAGAAGATAVAGGGIALTGALAAGGAVGGLAALSRGTSAGALATTRVATRLVSGPTNLPGAPKMPGGTGRGIQLPSYGPKQPQLSAIGGGGGNVGKAARTLFYTAPRGGGGGGAGMQADLKEQ